MRRAKKIFNKSNGEIKKNSGKFRKRCKIEIQSLEATNIYVYILIIFSHYNRLAYYLKY